MDNNKKRQKLENAIVIGSGMEALTSFTGPQDAIMVNAGQNTEDNIDLGAALPTNLYFTICDDISSESHEYLAINNNSTVTEIKEEPKRELSITDQHLQYRIVGQAPKKSDNNITSTTPAAITLRAVGMENSKCNPTPVNVESILPTTVQLPRGCEIYLVKEYVDSDASELLLSEDYVEPSAPGRLAFPHGVSVNGIATQKLMKSASVSILPRATIKNEPGTHTKFLETNVITPKIENNTLRVTAGSVASNYKKRDEKRRATHNEVERRRRDKINSWIFKLKEMLPTDTPNGGLALKTKVNLTQNSSTTTYLPSSGTSSLATDGIEKSHQLQYRGGNNCRSPPNDSKSQILIKACEYIRAMQNEVKSLRECLMENEKIRTSNLRLQSELEELKNNEQRRLNHEENQQSSKDTFDKSNNCGCSSEDFTLTLCSNGNSNLNDVTSSTIFSTTPSSPTSIAFINGRKSSVTIPYTKRELIITDYVD